MSRRTAYILGIVTALAVVLITVPVSRALSQRSSERASEEKKAQAAAALTAAHDSCGLAGKVGATWSPDRRELLLNERGSADTDGLTFLQMRCMTDALRIPITRGAAPSGRDGYLQGGYLEAEWTESPGDGLRIQLTLVG